jgi:hypothetical protein
LIVDKKSSKFIIDNRTGRKEKEEEEGLLWVSEMKISKAGGREFKTSLQKMLKLKGEWNEIAQNQGQRKT